MKTEKILEVKTMEELLTCDKYQKIRFKDTPKGEYEVYVGNILKNTCSCGNIGRVPITLRKKENGIIDASEILELDSSKKFNYAAVVQEVKPSDSDYQSILKELNMRVAS